MGPSSDIKASLSGDRTGKFGFAAVAQHVYGTPTLLGWWPSLMEDVSCMWSEPSFQKLQPPLLEDLLFYYELGAKGKSGVTSHVICTRSFPHGVNLLRESCWRISLRKSA